MRHTMTALIGAFVGVALLAGGSTYAEWSDTSTTTGSTITTGSLTIDLVGTPSWFDRSPDVNRPDAIEVGTFRTVPGDVLRMTQPLAVATSGTRMTAQLRVSAPSLSLPLAGITARYTLFAIDGVTRTAVPGATDIALGTPSAVQLASGSNDRDYTLEIDFSFLASAADQPLNVVAAKLEAVKIELLQTRS